MPKGMFLLNAKTGEVRTEQYNGKEHLVVPIVALVEGVLHSANAEDPELALSEQFNDKPYTWNGRPGMVDHPQKNGQYVSANAPDVLEKGQIGTIFNAKANGKQLEMEIWVDVAKANELGGAAAAMAEKLSKGDTVEVSTGLYADTIPMSGRFNGKPYAGIWTNIVPDHLAFLTVGEGACSVKDGCGAFRRNCSFTCKCEECMKDNIAAKAHTPKYNGTEDTPWGDVGKSLSDYISGYNKHNNAEIDPSTDVKSLASSVKAWIASKTLLGDSGADTTEDLIFFPVVNPATNKLNAGALRAVLGGRGSQADIPEEAKTSAQDIARRLLKDEYNVDVKSNESIWAKVKSLLSFTNAKKFSDVDKRNALQNAIGNNGYIVAVYDDSFVFETMDGLMSQDYAMNKDGSVSLGKKATPVRAEVKFVPIANEGSSDMDKAKFVKDLIANADTQFTAEDEAWLMEQPEARLEKLMPKANAAPPADDKEPKDKRTPAVTDPAPASNAAPKTVEEYIAAAPAEMQDVLSESLKLHSNRRKELIEVIKANKKNKFTEEQLAKMETSMLVNLAEIAEVVDYSARGAGGRAPQVNTQSDNLPPPMPLVFEAKKSA